MARTSKKTKTAKITLADQAAAVAEAVVAGVADMTAGGGAVQNGEGKSADIFIALDRLKKSPRNARKTGHSQATIEALAASIAAKGMFQNLVVEPELDAVGEATGFYLVTIGEGRRQAQLLRAERGEIDAGEPIRCVLDTGNDPHEISLDENVTREAMHPADQFEAFRDLAQQRGWGAEEIAARFGVTPHVVKQRLRLGAVSPKLLQVYRDEDLTLDQLMAFAITDDHARQEQVFDSLSPYNREPYVIRRELTRANVPASDRRAIFVGAAAYSAAGGTILRDLFTEDRGGFYEDAALLDQLVLEKLKTLAEEVRAAEGWKWADVHIDFPHAHGLRRVYPKRVALSEADEAAYRAAKAEFERLSLDWDSAEELPDDVDLRFGELEVEIDRLDASRLAYEADDIARGGLFVVLSYDGDARVERGFMRPEDERQSEDKDDETVIDGVRVDENGEVVEDTDNAGDEEGADGKPLSELLVRDLTAHRTLGLRLVLGQQPDVALVAVTHALAVQTFYHGDDTAVLDIRPTSIVLAGCADGIEDTPAAKTLADRHAAWAAEMPSNAASLWDVVAGLDHASLLALFAHCASLTVNAVKLPWERRPHACETADRLAVALALDMTAHWTPTVASYFGRITKAHILAAVSEAAGDAAAERIAGLKKQPMAQAAEQAVLATGWLPALMRTPDRMIPVEQDASGAGEALGSGSAGAQASASEAVEEVGADPDAIFPVAAE